MHTRCMLLTPYCIYVYDIIAEMEDNDPDGEDDADEFEEDLEALSAEIKVTAKGKGVLAAAAAAAPPAVAGPAVEGEPDEGGKKGEEEDLEGLISSLQKTTIEEKGGK